MVRRQAIVRLETGARAPMPSAVSHSSAQRLHENIAVKEARSYRWLAVVFT
jgi:hypothetical protein